jgi:hypothetical protein
MRTPTIALALVSLMVAAGPLYAQTQRPGPITAPQTLTTLGNAHAEAIHKETERAPVAKRMRAARTAETPTPARSPLESPVPAGRPLQ